MESMKSGSANHSHHPNKVAINSLETDSNKQTITSNVSGNTLNNNNKSSGNNQQEYQSTTESKDNNFEYDDNEWDVGGIGDLIKDLDNDIKKTSETDKLIAPSKNSTSERSNSRSSSSSPSSLSTPSSSSIVGNQNSPTEAEKNIGKSNLISIPINEKEELKKQATATNSITPIQANKQKHLVYIGQDKNQKQINKLITDCETIVTANNPKSIGNMSSNTTGQTTGKAGNKVSIDHQATLDKGLKMKIKRTKPGTKTSEAKHEIVKAEQNGSLSSGDDIIGKKSSLQQQNPQSSGGQQQAQQLIPNQPQIDSSTNKRQGGSLPTSAKGTHRRDKARDKTSYPQRDKTNNNMNSNNSRNGNPNNINNSDTSNSSASNSGDRTHNCHDTSSTASATTSDSNTGQNASLPSSTNMINTDSSASSSGSSTNNAYSSNTSTPGSESITKNPNAPGPPQNDSKSQQSNQSTNNVLTLSKTSISSTTSSSQSDPLNISISNQMSNISNGDESSPPAKKMKCEPKDMVDVCVGTSVGTITEPDCLGPCEPGTSVTLEGIVWHETEGGVLVVNVTWRGKTYVGTLLDCTRHDWAPPRFCDSPTEELDSRTPKGRAKRGRSAAQQPANDLSNFTETRSSVHSKLRNASAKGRASRSSSGTSITAASTTVTNVTAIITNTSTTSTTTSTMSSNLSTPTPSISPTVPRAEKRKCGLSILGSESSPPPSLNGSDSNGSNSESATMSDLNVQIPSKKIKTPCAVSPVLLECPEQDCSKKYKHANGLRYHQSHAHGSGSMDEDTQLPESPPCDSITTGLSTSALPSDSSHNFSSVQPIIQNQILNENSNMSAVSLTNQTPSINAQTPSKDSPSKGGSVSIGETSPIQIQNDFSSLRHGNELSPSQSRVDNENSNTMDSNAASQIAGSSNIVQTPTKGDIQGKASTPSQAGQPVSMVKAQKKQRKEGSSEFDSTQRDRDDVQSPAYSDISDDSTPVVDSEQISASSTTSDHSNGKQSTNVPAPISNDFTKVKEPPLDLIVKPSTQPSEHVNSKQPTPIPSSISSDFTKVKESSMDLKFNYYPYNYMPGYPYNIDPSYGPVSMIAEEGKMSTPQPMIKEERIKENPSPNDNTKSQLPIPLGKTIKTEPGKELKSHAPPGPLEGHSKDLTTSPIGSYPGMFQRQPLNVPQPQPPPPPQLREEELRRYYGMYPDQRRSSTSSSSSSANMPQSIKERSQSPSPSQNQREKERNDHSQPKNLKGSHGLAQSQKQTTKESKINDEKELAKPKQDIGQKPSFESQGPPPPPTSQFYAIHPPYMGPGPFGFEPPMYRNMMVPYNSSPYHLQMSRFHAPEDLSRNTNSKALDLLQHHSAQYYNSHKIHELSERALKSPTGSQTKTAVSSPVSQAQNQQIQPPVSQQQSMPPTPNSMNPNVLSGVHPNIQSSNPLQPPPTSMPLSATKNSSTTPTANMSGSAGDLSNKDGAPSERSPPPAMRHIHTHHHTHVGVGLGYPMYPAAYSAAVLTPQQAAVAVINPFPPGPNK